MRATTELKRNEMEALQNVATCYLVLHDQVTEVRRGLPDTTKSVVGPNADTAATNPVQAERVTSKQTSKDGSETDGSTHQY